jgi:hypothetical protein
VCDRFYGVETKVAYTVFHIRLVENQSVCSIFCIILVENQYRTALYVRHLFFHNHMLLGMILCVSSNAIMDKQLEMDTNYMQYSPG